VNPYLPDLSQSLQNQDPGFLRIVFELWGMEQEPDGESDLSFRQAIHRFASSLDQGLVLKVVEALPLEAREALNDLARNEGKLPWQMFTRRYGQVRHMGPGRRDRERPYLKPASPAEILWYRALVGRAFMDTPDGPQEFAFIPRELMGLLPAPPSAQEAPPGRVASPSERAHVIAGDDRILDHACTLLAALRLNLGFDSPEFVRASWPLSSPYAIPPQVLQTLLIAAGLVHAVDRLPLPEATRQFLEMPRPQALTFLVQAWLESPIFNELRLLPGLILEGEWQNDPLRARSAILEFVRRLPQATWWSLSAFVAAIKHTQPDFQRPAGDYDAWYIRSQASGAFLRGFDHWDDVDGALIRYLISGPMYWLGLVDLAAPSAQARPTAFRLSPWAASLLNGTPPSGLKAEDESLLVSSDGRVRVPRLAPRVARYLIARFCLWEGADDEVYSYRITSASLRRARQQGLKITHLLTVLRRHALSLPPSLMRALERWEEHGSEVRLERATILRVRTPQILQDLRKSPAARYLGDLLGPTVVTVKSGAADKVLAALVEMGYLGESEILER